MFSLAALAQTAVDRPSVDTQCEDSDLIDLRRVQPEAHDATVTPVPTAIPLLPLGVSPLGTPGGEAPEAAISQPDSGMPPWLLVAGSIAVAAVILGVAFLTRSGPTIEPAPAAPPSAVERPDPEPEPEVSASAAPSASAAATSSADPSPEDVDPVEPRPPLPLPPPTMDRRPPPPPPPVKPANPCASCGTDLTCSMRCRVNGG